MKMYLVAIGWAYVVGIWALVEALSPQGSVLGALATLLFYGVLPLAVLLYILGTPARRRRRGQREAEASAPPDGRDHAAGDALAPEREEP